MSKEIRFRAKRRFNGTIGSDIWIEGTNIRIHPRGNTKAVFLEGQECDYETLSEWTGLHDSKVTPIYEGGQA